MTDKDIDCKILMNGNVVYMYSFSIVGNEIIRGEFLIESSCGLLRIVLYYLLFSYF